MGAAIRGHFVSNGYPLHTPSHARVPAEPQSGPTNSFGRCKCWVLILADRGWPGVRGVKGIPIFLQCRQIGGGITPEAGAQDMRLAPPIETLPELFPLFPITQPRSDPLGARWRVAMAATKRASPRSTAAGEAVLRPVARRS